MKQFVVEDCSRDGERLVVRGRCGDDPLHIGDQFLQVAEYEKPQTLADYGKPPVMRACRPTRLTVLSMWAYGRFWEELAPGLTAEVTLSGRAPEEIVRGNVLEIPVASRNPNGNEDED